MFRRHISNDPSNFPLTDPTARHVILACPAGTRKQPPRLSHRVVAAQLHGAAGDDDGGELPAHGAVGEQLPGPLRLQAPGFGLLLQDLVQLAALDVAALQASQSFNAQTRAR